MKGVNLKLPGSGGQPDRKKRISLRFHYHGAELAKMLVESHCSGTAQMSDGNLASAIGEAPVFVAELLENPPSVEDLLGCQVMHGRKLAGEEPGSKHYRALVFAPHSQESERFVHNVVRGCQWATILLKPFGGGRMISVPRHNGGKPSAGIDENQFTHG